jgi:polar amino acid transport system substrate-binding protein
MMGERNGARERQQAGVVFADDYHIYLGKCCSGASFAATGHYSVLPSPRCQSGEARLGAATVHLVRFRIAVMLVPKSPLISPGGTQQGCWMKFKKIIPVLLLSTMGVLANAAPATQRLRLLTESSPSMSMMEGNKVIGSATEKIREIMERTGTEYTIELLPWRRAFTLSRQGPDVCLFSTTRTPDREHLFKWVGPTDEAAWVLLGRADRRYHLHTLEDARALRIGTYNGDARDEYLRTRGFKVDPAPNDMINPRKLLLDRIDLWAASIKSGSSVLERNGWSGKIVPVFEFNRVGVYLACNPAVPTGQIDRMNAALEAMGRDGTIKRIDRKYENWVEGANKKSK